MITEKAEYGVRKTTLATIVWASDITQNEIDCIRHNWSKLGADYWFSDYGREFWKSPDGVTIEFYAG